MKRKKLSILGATGSIGESTLNVIALNPERFEVVALSAHRNTRKLAEQCARFGARLAVIADPERVDELASQLRKAGSSAEILAGQDGLATAAGLPEIDAVMAAIVGAAGLAPTFHAARSGKTIFLANKESLVIAGQVFIAEARRRGATVLPVDSEHNAIFQSLPPHFTDGLDAIGVEKIILTASGGPFLDLPASRLAEVTPEQACAHPNWSMGRKISVDSATLMNKGLEVIEARWLFDAQPGQIDVLVHPQSIVHSMVSYRDGSVIAQLGTPDMRTPIANVLAWPERISAGVEHLNLAQINDLSFREPDLDRFPCLALAFRAMEAGDNAPAVLNAANEVAVEQFLEGRIGFDRIPDLVADVLNRVPVAPIVSLDDVFEQDRLARDRATHYALKRND
jgi:1-deoxy-D-xylulose-5-phosphate reductoisomerase